MEQVCLSTPVEWAGIATGIVTLFSFLANFVKGDSVIAKAVHFLALNIKVSK